MNITFDQRQRYRNNIKIRRQKNHPERESRRQQGWESARQAAQLLQREFQVERVLVFGSLLHPDRFTQWSDVDLAAWGLTSDNWLQAILTVYELSTDIELNLVDVRTCSPEFVETIEREGVDLCSETSLTELIVN